MSAVAPVSSKGQTYRVSPRPHHRASDVFSRMTLQNPSLPFQNNFSAVTSAESFARNLLPRLRSSASILLHVQHPQGVRYEEDDLPLAMLRPIPAEPSPLRRAQKRAAPSTSFSRHVEARLAPPPQVNEAADPLHLLPQTADEAQTPNNPLFLFVDALDILEKRS